MVLILLNDCATPIKNETFYVDAGISGAVTVEFFPGGQSVVIPKAQWDATREGMYCMSFAALGDFKKEIEELCASTPCDEATNSQADDFFFRAGKAHDFAKGLK